jgi:hypothetical protein
MKKVKIMFMSIAVLAVVGGALAFKAKFNQPICTMDPGIDPTTVTNTLACPVVPATLTIPNPEAPVLTTNPALTLTYIVAGKTYCTPTACTSTTWTTID